MRGSSGATFAFDVHEVHKMGDARVVAQGRWLEERCSSAFPAVLGVFDTGYTMERLTPVDPRLLDVANTCSAIMSLLQESCWSEPAVIEFDAQLFAARAHNLVDVHLTPAHTSFIDGLLNSWLRTNPQMTTALAHGDPTLDNVMLHPNTGNLVICDPLPATGYAPDVRAVDLGKLLQSASGWEAARYGYEVSTRRATWHRIFSDVYDEIRLRFGTDEANAAYIFAVFHLLRTLPYVKVDVRRRIVNGPLALVMGRGMK